MPIQKRFIIINDKEKGIIKRRMQHLLECQQCGESFWAFRISTLTCSNACRMQKYLETKK